MDQLLVPVAAPLPPRLFDQTTRAMPELCEATPARAIVALVAVKVDAAVGAVIWIAGAFESGGVEVITIVRMSLAPLFATARTTMLFAPACKATPGAVHEVPVTAA